MDRIGAGIARPCAFLGFIEKNGMSLEHCGLMSYSDIIGFVYSYFLSFIYCSYVQQFQVLCHVIILDLKITAIIR